MRVMMLAIASSVDDEVCWHVLSFVQEEAMANNDIAADAARIEIFFIFRYS